MSTSPSRTEFGRVSSRIKGKYTSGEHAGNVETVLQLSSSHDDIDHRGDDNDMAQASPYGLRRIFSNPPASVRRTSIETSMLEEERLPFHHSQQNNRKGYGLRRIFSNPHSDVDTGVPLTKTKSYHHPSRAPPGSPVSLVRRVSRLKQQGDKDKSDDDTVAESVEVSLSSSTKSFKRNSNSNKRRWALLFAFLGVAGAGAYAGYTFLSGGDDQKKKKKSRQKKQPIYTQSLQSFGGSSKFNSLVLLVFVFSLLC
jgi:hypothetical protein